MSLIKKMRKQNAVYWPPAAPDSYGRRVPGTPVALVQTSEGNFRVRWEEVGKQFAASSILTLGSPPSQGDVSGTVLTSDALVYVPQLPDGTEVEVGGYLWLGDIEDLVGDVLTFEGEELTFEGETLYVGDIDPIASGAREVKRVDRLPTLKATEFLRTAYL